MFAPSSSGSQSGPLPGTYARDWQSSGNGHYAAYSICALTTGGPAPAVDIEGSATNWPASYNGFIHYYFMVNGTPGNGQYVNVMIHSLGHASASGDATAYARCELLGHIIGAASAGPGTLNNPEWDVTLRNYPVPVGIPVEIDLYAKGSTGNTGEFQAVADPTIEIDPSFPNHEQYTLTFSANLVPEPAGAVTALLLLQPLLAQRRRRRRR